MKIRIHPEARMEADAAKHWYRERSTQAEWSFVQVVDEAMKNIATDPERFPWIDSRHRSCLLLPFPFQIVCQIEVDRIHIVAFAHAKRRPGYWRHR